LTPVSLLPFATGMSGVLYLIGALLLDAGFIFYVVRLWRSDDNKNALYTFNYSIFYLLILFVVLLVDHFL
jgi:protoheme IX farnesyltransferase